MYKRKEVDLGIFGEDKFILDSNRIVMPLEDFAESFKRGLKRINTPGVYILENMKNGKVRVGSSIKVFHRLNNGYYERLQTDTFRNYITYRHLQEDFLKYGAGAFLVTIYVLPEISLEKLLDIENTFINLYKSYEPAKGYNQHFYLITENGLVPQGWRAGEDHHNSKLTKRQVEKIRELRREKNVPSKLLAKRFKVTVRNIDHILSGCTWNRDELA